MEVEINNLTEAKEEEISVISFVLETALKFEKIENAIFNVIIVDNSYIHNLNKTYRGIDRETDVITFALEDEKEMLGLCDVRILGDIYISIEKAREQAREYGHSLRRELSFLAVHGFYHLLGYDHMTENDEKVMFGKQDKILEICGIEREEKE